MSRRAVTFSVATFLLLAMIVAAALLPVPYVVLSPGPVADTLGSVPTGDGRDGETGGPVIQITGVKTHQSSGHLYLTTVALTPGDCNVHPRLFDAIGAWFDAHKTVEPQQVQCPPGVSSEAVQQQGVDQMARAQSNAIYAAMTELGYRATGSVVFIDSVTAGLPAASVLKPNDVVLTANGTRIKRTQQLVDIVQAVRPGDKVSLVVERGNVRRSYDVATAKSDEGKAQLGIAIVSRPTFDGIDVSIGLDPHVIGGPSAGAALALGIIDKLTPGGLTGGRTIAGTGTIDRQGKVGPIGGIQQKVAAAVRAGATVFFAPASECADARAAAPSSLTLISVKNLHGAVQALEAIKSGSTAFPRC